MTKRRIVFGTYDTSEDGLWTLSGWSLSDPEHEQNLLKIPGSSLVLDLSTALTDGEPTYGPRTLTVDLESSEGDRLEREARIETMTNWLDGWRVNITLPDDDLHYLVGRVRVKRKYNDLAHGAVQVVATCDPWRYNVNETIVTRQATEAEQSLALVNMGRLAVTPLLTITGGSVLLTFGAASWSLGAGTYVLPDIYLRSGEHPVTYKGTGSLTFSYREAKL